MSEGNDEGGEGSDAAEQTGSVAEAAQEASETPGESIAGLIHGEEGDSTAEDVERSFTGVGQAAGGVAQGAQAWHQSESAVRSAQHGDGWGAAAGGLGAGAGTAGHLAGGLDSLASATNDAGVRDAARAVRTVQAAAALAGTVVRRIGDVVRSGEAAANTQSRHVEYELHVADVSERWRVHHFALTEALNEPYEVVLELVSEHEEASPSDLLGKNAELILDRREHTRRVCGVVRRVIETGSRAHHLTCTIHVVPALWLLRQQTSSRIFQDKTVPEILDAVLGAALRRSQRELDRGGLNASYPRREYCVQFRESDLDFAHRLMEEEAIGYHFDAEGDGWEKLVLFDRNGGLAEVPTLDGAAIPFSTRAEVVAQAEPIVDLHNARQLTTTALMVRDHDWTQSTPRVEQTREGEDEQGRMRMHYDHGLAGSVTIWDYQEGSGRYGQNDVERQAAVRHELLLQPGHTMQGISLVTGFAPGRTFAVQGHPTQGFDGEYVVTRVVHTSDRPPGVDGAGASAEEYHNRFECQPIAAEYRPERRTRKPRIYGIQTARVTGPGNDGEIFTDYYGRIKVLFPWDREGGDPGRTSCWMRVAQTWAGFDGMGYPGFVFIPRVGMEAIVTFLDGDPDRPLVTGTVYNAQSLPPEALPDEASRSMIRTRSLGGSGYNELSFEDRAGHEEVHLRAERNLRELVRNDHTTRVGHDQTNHVAHDQTNTVDNDQTETIHHNRTKTVDGDETIRVDGTRDATIGRGGGDDRLWVIHNQELQVDGARRHEVAQDETIHVRGQRLETVERGITSTISRGIVQRILSGGWGMTTHGVVNHDVTGSFDVTATQGVSLRATSGSNVHVEGHEIRLQSATQVTVIAPQGLHEVGLQSNTRVHDTLIDRVIDATHIEDTSIKIYKDLAASLGPLKVDVWAMKVDLWGAKFSTNKGPELNGALAKIHQSASAHITRFRVKILGP